jgi:hypothetical protein
MGIYKRFAKYQWVDLGEFVVGALSTISALLAIYEVFQGQGASVVVFGLFTTIGLCVVFFIKVLKLSQVSQKRLFVFAETFNACTEVIQKDFHYLERIHNLGHLTAEQLLDNARATCQDFVSRLAQALSESTIERVSVCVKYFPENYPRGPKRIRRSEEYYLDVLCRSHNTAAERIKTKGWECVKDNTAIVMIMKERKPYFRARDLDRFNKARKEAGLGSYRNPNSNWHDHYRATIVTPISAERRFRAEGGEYEADLLGFLCADSLSTSAFRVVDIDAYTNLMKAFARLLYPYFDRMYSYLQEIDEGGLK